MLVKPYFYVFFHPFRRCGSLLLHHLVMYRRQRPGSDTRYRIHTGIIPPARSQLSGGSQPDAADISYAEPLSAALKGENLSFPLTLQSDERFQIYPDPDQSYGFAEFDGIRREVGDISL